MFYVFKSAYFSCYFHRANPYICWAECCLALRNMRIRRPRNPIVDFQFIAAGIAAQSRRTEPSRLSGRRIPGGQAGDFFVERSARTFIRRHLIVHGARLNQRSAGVSHCPLFGLVLSRFHVNPGIRELVTPHAVRHTILPVFVAISLAKLFYWFFVTKFIFDHGGGTYTVHTVHRGPMQEYVEYIEYN